MKKILTGTLAACFILGGAALSSEAADVQVYMKWYGVPGWCGSISGEQIQIPGQTPEQTPEIEVTPDVQQPEQAPEQTPETDTAPEIQQPEAGENSYAQQVLDLVNAERTKNGLSALALDESLNAVALAHSKDMATRNFFSHTNPDGQSPFDRMKANGISYRTAGENIAAGQATPEAVVNGWMNSEGHRKNILNGSFTKMGLGFYQTQSGYKTYWTQLFIG